MFSVSASSLSVLWNVEALPPFSPGRGLRQGDPLSPYLFILVMEKLAYMIQDKVNQGLWKPFKVSRGGFALTHLFFADDLILFGKATENQLTIIMNCLNSLASVSGLALNLSKSKLFTSPKVSLRVAWVLSRRCGIPRTTDLGFYLGAPIIHGRVTKETHGFILERMAAKLSSWKRNTLSLAGRRTLVQSVTQSIPVYSMQNVLLPASICYNIDRLNMNFLWGSDEGNRKIHHLNWNTVCLKKEQGGLSLRKARDNNLALVSKLGWRILKNDQVPWCQALKHKYLRSTTLWTCGTQSASPTWRAILKCRDVLRAGTIWRIGDGRDVLFWKDRWLDLGPLETIVDNPVPESSDSFRVAQAIHPNGNWDLNFLSAFLPQHVLECIRGLPRPMETSIKDDICWSGTPDGSFSLKSAFALITSQSLDVPSGEWIWIWKIPCIERIRTFLWLIMHDRLLTNFTHFYRHMTTSADCPRCTGIEENLSHLLRDCPIARETWQRLGVRSSGFFSPPIHSWIRLNSTAKASYFQETTPWFLVFLGAIWYLWKRRNLFVFEGKSTPPFQIARKALAHARETAGTFKVRSITFRAPTLVRWSPPPENYFKLNTDGSLDHTSHNASAGGLVRRSGGSWVTGYLVNIGIATSFAAELWGLREGLKLCLSLGVTHLLIEMDSSTIVNMLQRDNFSQEALSLLMIDCAGLLKKLQNCSINHIF